MCKEIFPLHTLCTLAQYTSLVSRVSTLKFITKGNIMKKVILASVLAFGFGLGFAQAESSAAVELEHANKTAASAEGQAGDMSKMKAAGKCNADQSGKIKVKKQMESTSGKAETELEHAVKSQSSDEAPKQDMSKMKAAGKCNSGQ